MAENRDQAPIPAEQIASDLSISRDFISKTLQSLVQEGILNSYRGKTGGFSLEREPESMSLLDIILVVDGNGVFESCVLGMPSCDSNTPCPVHDQWGPLREASREMLASTTVAQFKPLIKK